jgi:outer membrane protein assembly factor BamB
MIARVRRLVSALALTAGLASCLANPGPGRDPDLGKPMLHLRWRLVTSDRAREIRPQEFASIARVGDHVYTGSAGGRFFSLNALDGRVRWQEKIGSVSSRPAVAGTLLYVGTDDGELVAIDMQTGKVAWKHEGRGPVLETPVVVDDLVIYSNEADQVFALDARKGTSSWTYKGESPEEYTLRGHAGVTVSGDLAFTGFANGTMVALRVKTGSVAWLTTLKGDSDRFVDVDGTPVVVGDTVYVTSSSGGVWAIDRTTGLVRWRVLLEGATASSGQGAAGGVATDGERLYVAAADLGVYALDLDGNILWRQGTRGGGEPATPIVTDELIIYALADAGVFIADKRTGELLEYFDPGDGISGDPTVIDEQELYVLSNRGVLYAMDLREI